MMHFVVVVDVARTMETAAQMHFCMDKLCIIANGAMVHKFLLIHQSQC